MGDFRIYYFDTILHKNSSIKKKHKYKTLADAVDGVEKHRMRRHRENQFLIIEYTGNFNSKIVKLIEPICTDLQ